MTTTTDLVADVLEITETATDSALVVTRNSWGGFDLTVDADEDRTFRLVASDLEAGAVTLMQFTGGPAMLLSGRADLAGVPAVVIASALAAWIDEEA